MTSNLQKRVVTAILLVVPLVAALFYFPAIGVALLFGLFVAAGAWEWAVLSGLQGGCRIGYVGAVIAVGGAVLMTVAQLPGAAAVIFGAAAIWWPWATFELRRNSGGVFYSRGGRVIAGFLVLVPAWAAIFFLHATDPRQPLALLFVLVLVGLADTAAYATGRMFGRTKLAPTISPGKTVEGVMGGILVVVLLAYFCGTMIWRFQGVALGAWIALAVVTALVSVVGDLAESKVKRVAGVKDSGNLLPGHGGVLDRIDAITAAAPVYALGWLLWFDARV